MCFLPLFCLVKSVILKKKFFISIIAIWTLILVSQYISSWSIRSAKIIWDTGNRPEGFYSNALTTAYVIFLIFPLVAVNFFKNKSLYWAISALTICTALFVNNSRMVMAVAGLLAGINVLIFLKGKARIITIAIGVVIAAATLTTKNPISNRVHNLFKQGENVTYKGYADHRLVFWDVYSDMIKEKPVFGHGPKLTSAYVTKYYDARGFEDFDKKYAAHNQFIQAAGNSGLLGLFFFLSWVILFSVNLFKNIENKTYRLILLQTFLGFMFAGLTQNAFQDAEVRQGIMLLSIFALLYSKPSKIEVGA